MMLLTTEGQRPVLPQHGLAQQGLGGDESSPRYTAISSSTSHSVFFVFRHLSMDSEPF